MAKTPAKTPAEPDRQTEGSDSSAPELTAADVASRVQRTVIYTEGREVRTKQVPIAPEEVLSWRDYGTHLVVVTVDGQKFSDRPAQD